MNDTVELDASNLVAVMVAVIIVLCIIAWGAFHMGHQVAERKQWIKDSFHEPEYAYDRMTGLKMELPPRRKERSDG